jgi:hypothetical protein
LRGVQDHRLLLLRSPRKIIRQYPRLINSSPLDFQSVYKVYKLEIYRKQIVEWRKVPKNEFFFNIPPRKKMVNRLGLNIIFNGRKSLSNVRFNRLIFLFSSVTRSFLHSVKISFHQIKQTLFVSLFKSVRFWENQSNKTNSKQPFLLVFITIIILDSPWLWIEGAIAFVNNE